MWAPAVSFQHPCDAKLDPKTRCSSPAEVLFHLGFVIVPRCSMHAEASTAATA